MSVRYKYRLGDYDIGEWADGEVGTKEQMIAAAVAFIEAYCDGPREVTINEEEKWLVQSTSGEPEWEEDEYPEGTNFLEDGSYIIGSYEERGFEESC